MVFETEALISHKKKFSQIERLKMLVDIEEHLIMKLGQLESGQLDMTDEDKLERKLCFEYQGPDGTNFAKHRLLFETNPEEFDSQDESEKTTTIHNFFGNDATKPKKLKTMDNPETIAHLFSASCKLDKNSRGKVSDEKQSSPVVEPPSSLLVSSSGCFDSKK